MRRRKCLENLARDWQLHLFMLLPMIYIVVFAYFPMVGAQIAFRKYSARLGMWKSPWVGLDNFTRFFSSVYFGRTLGNTLILSFYSIFATFPIPILFALCLNSLNGVRFRKVAQTITTMPYYISVVVLVGILLQLFNSRTGLYGNLCEALTGKYPPDLFAKPGNFRHMYVWSGAWQGFGWSSIIYTAALSSVDPALHEAAQIDGASRFQRVCHIDFPSILPTIVIMLILRTGSVMGIGFEKVYLMQNNLNLSASEVISTYVYKIGMEADITDYSYSTAIGLFNSVANLIVISFINMLAGRMGQTSLW
ncbi:MAG: ABC transporter permease subunit [Eubacteriales bacterium]|nr:ABC transporter permease subunit [Eubacteriales bacterium]